jgi:hypothetical protein
LQDTWYSALPENRGNAGSGGSSLPVRTRTLPRRRASRQSRKRVIGSPDARCLRGTPALLRVTDARHRGSSLQVRMRTLPRRQRIAERRRSRGRGDCFRLRRHQVQEAKDRGAARADQSSAAPHLRYSAIPADSCALSERRAGAPAKPKPVDRVSAIPEHRETTDPTVPFNPWRCGGRGAAPLFERT